MRLSLRSLPGVTSTQRSTILSQGGQLVMLLPCLWQDTFTKWWYWWGGADIHDIYDLRIPVLTSFYYRYHHHRQHHHYHPFKPLPDDQRWFFSLQNRCFTNGGGWCRWGGGRTKSLLSGTVRLWTRTPRAGDDYNIKHKEITSREDVMVWLMTYTRSYDDDDDDDDMFVFVDDLHWVLWWCLWYVCLCCVR